MLALFTLLAALPAAPAEVYLGRNARVGGHDVSNRSFDRKNRAVIHLHERTPTDSGCARRFDDRGGRVKTCHLHRIR